MTGARPPRSWRTSCACLYERASTPTRSVLVLVAEADRSTIDDMAHRPTVRAANGAVATGHGLATAAGIAALRDDGSAVDAAIALPPSRSAAMPAAVARP